ncbi:MAG: cyclic nucleotide-binding domain-containing protein [Burkholderiaceae bacterium]|nr:cyclic nucleotide-binding domain-containing protein [Burkholderiaceae bacterium]MCU0966495.1 cyclic nucleotide-binding domain-containing protein [Burkholderiaceae bacterium]
MEPQLAQLLAQVAVSWDTLVLRVQSSPQQMLAHGAIALAFLLTLAGAYARTMMPLRWLAAASGVFALAYAVLAPAPITLLTAGLLLPLNLWRAVEVTRLTQRVRRAGVQADMAGVWLKPYMKSRRLKAGQLLFAKGDFADRLYMLVQGQAELAEIGRPLEAGRIFGEIALFSPDQTRTQTVRAVSDCTVLEIAGSTVKELFYQSPAFGFHLMELLAMRLGADVQRAEQRAAPQQAVPAA